MKATRIADKVRAVLEKRGLTKNEAAKEIGVHYTTIIRLLDGTHKWQKPDNEAKILAWLARHGQRPPISNATPLEAGIRLVKVYGMAQALGCRMHHGDLVPENEYDLPTIPVLDDGRRYAAFKVEGESMLPTLRDGWVVLCDCSAECHNGDLVVAKHDGVALIKRYRRVGDTVLFTSDNPSAGKDYEAHASQVAWCLKVVGFHGTL